MTALAKHWNEKTWIERVEAFGALLSVLAFLGGGIFGLVHTLGATMQTPGDRLGALQSAQQADHAAVLTLAAQAQSHADALNQLAATRAQTDTLAPRVKGLEDYVIDHKRAVIEKDSAFAAIAADVAAMKASQAIVLTELQNLHEDVRLILRNQTAANP
jgi:hypothetical protein